MRYEINIKGFGKVLGIRAPLDGVLEIFRLEGINRPLTMAELADARIKAGPQSELCTFGAFACEAVIHTETGPNYFVRNSPLLETENMRKAAPLHNALEAVQETLHTKTGYGEIFFGETLDNSLYDTFVSWAEEDKDKPPRERRVFISDKTKSYRIPVDEIGSNELIQWAFNGPELAADYAKFLKSAEIESMPVWFVEWLNPDPNRKPFLRQLFFGAFEFGSSFNGGRRLGFDDELRGGAWGMVKNEHANT